MAVCCVGLTAGGALHRHRARARARSVSPALLAVVGALSVACGDPAADVLAAWITADVGVEVQQVQIYDGGRRYSVPWTPSLPGSGTELLQIGVDPRGRGVALSGLGSTSYQSLRDARRGILDEGDYENAFSFTRNGDGVMRFFRLDAQGHPLALMPTTSAFGMRSAELRPPVASSTSTVWTTLTAANAPVLVWVEQSESPLRTDGVVQAVAYPSSIGETLSVSEPTVLATGALHGAEIVDAAAPARIAGDSWCPGRTCIAPSGRVLSTMMPDEPCVLRLWTWTSAPDAETPVVAERVPLPSTCPVERDPWLIAQIADDVFVLEDDDLVHVADLGANTMVAVPKLGDGSADMLVRDAGRVVLLVSLSGQVVHVDASGPRLLAAEQTVCSLRDGLAASPSGQWVAQTCGLGGGSEGFAPAPPVGSIVRVSSLGLERYFGVSMRVLGIDDEGNVLLYSYALGEAQGNPRSLFVLTGDGQLARVDPLDEKPAPVLLSTGIQGRFAASPID
jgi:hypothetical protein